MEVEGDGGIKKVGRSGVNWGSLSVCAKTPALWAGIPSPLWVMAVVPERRDPVHQGAVLPMEGQPQPQANIYRS